MPSLRLAPKKIRLLMQQLVLGADAFEAFAPKERRVYSVIKNYSGFFRLRRCLVPFRLNIHYICRDEIFYTPIEHLSVGAVLCAVCR